jgi:hypothetical protein
VTKLHHHPLAHTASQRRYQLHTARAARRVAGVFGAHLWGLGDLPAADPGTDAAMTAPTQSAPVADFVSEEAGTSPDSTHLPLTATVAPDALVPSIQTGMLAVAGGAAYGLALGAISAASFPGMARGALGAGGLSAFGVALAFATTGSKGPALGFGLGAAGALGLAIYLAVRSRRARGGT